MPQTVEILVIDAIKRAVSDDPEKIADKAYFLEVGFITLHGPGKDLLENHEGEGGIPSVGRRSFRLLSLAYRQRHRTGQNNRAYKDDKDAYGPLCGLPLPLSHVEASEAQQQVDEGNERAQQMECLPHE